MVSGDFESTVNIGASDYYMLIEYAMDFFLYNKLFHARNNPGFFCFAVMAAYEKGRIKQPQSALQAFEDKIR